LGKDKEEAMGRANQGPVRYLTREMFLTLGLKRIKGKEQGTKKQGHGPSPVGVLTYPMHKGRGTRQTYCSHLPKPLPSQCQKVVQHLPHPVAPGEDILMLLEGIHWLLHNGDLSKQRSLALMLPHPLRWP